MPIVSLIGIKEGVGNTSVSAALATILAQQGKNVLAIDLCPDNALRLHLGMPWEASPTSRACPTTYSEWRKFTWRSPDGAFFLPNNVRNVPASDITAQESAEWVIKDLPQLVQSSDNWILLDTPIFGSITQQALSVADIAIIVTNNTPSSYIRVLEAWPALEAARQCQKMQPPLLVINQFDPRSLLESDVHELYYARFGDRCFPRAIPYDTRVGESLAKGLNIASYAPSSPVTSRIGALPLWIKAQKQLPKNS